MTETEKPAPDGLERYYPAWAVGRMNKDERGEWVRADQAQSIIAELREECRLSMQTIADEHERAEAADARIKALEETRDSALTALETALLSADPYQHIRAARATLNREKGE